MNNLQTRTVCLATAYLAPVQYYAKLLAYGHALIEQHDHYAKQTYRNRCVIAGPGGPLALTIPTVKPADAKCPVRDIRISDHGQWRHLHWNALASAYNHTPFFEYYKDDFRPFYEQRYDFLVDFNEALCRLVCQLIGFEPQLQRTTAYHATLPPDTDDFRERIHPKRDFRTDDPTFRPVPYYQVFQQRLGFLPNLSVADLLFNMGPESLLVLQQCQPAAAWHSAPTRPATRHPGARLAAQAKRGMKSSFLLTTTKVCANPARLNE